MSAGVEGGEQTQVAALPATQPDHADLYWPDLRSRLLALSRSAANAPGAALRRSQTLILSAGAMIGGLAGGIIKLFWDFDEHFFGFFALIGVVVCWYFLNAVLDRFYYSRYRRAYLRTSSLLVATDLPLRVADEAYTSRLLEKLRDQMKHV